MKSKTYNKLLVTTVLFVIALQTTVTEAAVVGRNTLGYLNANGAVELINSCIKSRLTVNGSLTAVNTTLNSVFINGSADINASVVESNAIINGSLTAKASDFKSSIEIATENVQLSGTSIKGDLIIKKITPAIEQTVVLSDKCRIEGRIIFESGLGQVKADSSSKILGGVQGAIE